MKTKFTLVLLILNVFALSIRSQSLWSESATWGGDLPAAGEAVTIAAGMHVILDMDTPDLAGLTIEGTLEFANQDINLTADWILVTGSFLVGSVAAPYVHQATITLNATNTLENIMGMGTRGIMVMGGTLELHGNPPAVPWTKINAHAPVGSNSLTLMESVNWSVNDQIALAPTDYFDVNNVSITETANLTSVNGTSLGLNSNLNAFHWGLLQYATNTGMSLSNTNLVTPPAASGFTPTTLDQRAPVGNLTRNIVICAPDDDLWNNSSFGFHLMMMRMGLNQPTIHVNGVEFRRGGQMGLLGRYPFHWHMLSYEDCEEITGTCQTLDDATGHYLRNSTINESMHRGIVIHGTNGVEVSNNIVYNVRGHGIFTEDASERRNLIDGNLVLHVRNPAVGLKVHETGGDFGRGSSGYWISNPDNILTNNTAADCGTNGFWLAFPQNCWGLSRYVPIIPNRLQFGTFSNNTTHSNRLEGIMLDFVETSELGNITPIQYISTSDGQNPSWPWATILRFSLYAYKTWKNGSRGIWDRGVFADNFEVVSADNHGRYFAGSGADGVIERGLMVGTSLNHMMNGYDRPGPTGEDTPAAFATYHSAFDIRDNIVINFPEVNETMSGAFATNDYYLRPVEKGQIRNTNNLFIDAHPGVKLEAEFSYFSLSGALWDPNGTWGGDTGDYLVYDQPFFTAGQTPDIVPPGSATGGVLVDGPFYGFNEFVVNLANIRWEDYMQITVERLDDGFNNVGTWNVDEAQPGWGLAHMRHFAAHPDDYYSLTFPTIPDVFDVGISVSNMLSSSDAIVLAVEYSNQYTVQQVFTSTYYNYLNPGYEDVPASNIKHIYTEVASRQDVIDSEGETYWQDVTNNQVWIKVQGGIDQIWNPADYAANSDELLYWLFYLRIFGESNALPVELLDFKAELNEKEEVELKWHTVSEIDHAYFEVEKSKNGLDWGVLDRMNSNSEYSNSGHYFLLDQKPYSGATFYRLKIVDNQGTVSYSNIIEVYLKSAQSSAELYPNPSKDFIKLNLHALETEFEIKILDINGKIYLHKNFNNLQQVELDISNFNNGLYFLEILSSKGNQILKFIKE